MAIDSSLSEVDRAILEREATAQSRSPSGPSGAYQDKYLNKNKKERQETKRKSIKAGALQVYR